jgi:hypothetical protein
MEVRTVHTATMQSLSQTNLYISVPYIYNDAIDATQFTKDSKTNVARLNVKESEQKVTPSSLAVSTRMEITQPTGHIQINKPSINELNEKETEQHLTPPSPDMSTRRKTTQTTEDVKIDMTSTNNLKGKEPEKKVSPSTRDIPKTTELTPSTQQVKNNISSVSSSPQPETITTETTEPDGARDLKKEPLTRTTQNTSSDNLFCENKSTQKCSYYGLYCPKLLCKILHWYFTSLLINGEERVEHTPLNKEDFTLNDNIKVAAYNAENLKNHWNKSMMHQPFTKQVWRALTKGILKRTFPIISVFLIIYYSISVFILTQLCDPTGDTYLSDATQEWIMRRIASGTSDFPGFPSESSDFPRLGEHFSINATYFCNHYDDITRPWSVKEHRLTRVLTFLIGFYVSFVVRNWWRQVENFPTLDKALLGMGCFIWVDSDIKEDEITVTVGKKTITLMQFKKDIIRYFLLSWAMCFCRISRRLKHNLPDSKAFLKKDLLKKAELKQLNSNTNDGWLEKWATPLLWISKMSCNVSKNVAWAKHVTDLNGKDIEAKDLKFVKIKEPKEIGIALFKYKDDLQRLNNQYYFRLPSFMRHAILIALYFYILLGAFAGQALIFHMNNEMSFWEKLFFNFPLYICMKHLLLVGWLKTATDLQNPFGEDENDVDLPLVLDYEIWKASHMLFQKIPYDFEIDEEADNEAK